MGLSQQSNALLLVSTREDRPNGTSGLHCQPGRIKQRQVSSQVIISLCSRRAVRHQKMLEAIMDRTVRRRVVQPDECGYPARSWHPLLRAPSRNLQSHYGTDTMTHSRDSLLSDMLLHHSTASIQPDHGIHFFRPSSAPSQGVQSDYGVNTSAHNRDSLPSGISLGQEASPAL